jgi:hypothetical protein
MTLFEITVSFAMNAKNQRGAALKIGRSPIVAQALNLSDGLSLVSIGSKIVARVPRYLRKEPK